MLMFGLFFVLYFVNPISAGGVESTPLQVFPSASPQIYTDQLQTFWLLTFTMET